MVPNLIEIADARVHLRADDTDSDEWFEMWIPIVSQSIATWLGDEWRLYEWKRDGNGEVIRDVNGNPEPFVSISGQPVVNRLVRGAALIELAEIYTRREGEGRNFYEGAGNAAGGWGYTLSAGATALLVGLRKSRIA